MTPRPASLSPPAFEPREVRAGEWRVTALSDGFFRLDGGSMWGVVPASLWRNMTPPLEDNTILLAVRPFLAEREGVRMVIEPGIGNRWEAKWRDIYHMQRATTLSESLAALGLAPGDVTHVLATHCHWDHVGGQVVERDGRLEPLFPNARHYAPRIEIEIAKRPGHARAASYRAEDVAVIENLGLLEPYEGAAEIVPGIRATVLGGHSDGVAVVTVNEDGPGETAIFWSDVVPTTHHVQPPYIMAYDLDVARSFEVRSEWMARAAEKGWIGLFYHDVDHAFARLSRTGRRFEAQELAGEPRTASVARDGGAARSAPLRIVSLCPSLTELVYDLGRGDDLVGITSYCVHPAERVAAVEKVGGTKDPDVERIRALEPDLVLMNDEENRREDYDALRAAGLACLSSLPKDATGTARMVREIGAALARDEEAERIAQDVEARAARVQAAAAGLAPVRYAYLIWRKPWMSVNDDTFAAGLLALAGGRNVFGGRAERYPEVTAEELAAAEPELVLLCTEPFPFEERHVEELSRVTGLPRERMRIADGELLSWHGSRTPAGIDYAEQLIRAARGA